MGGIIYVYSGWYRLRRRKQAPIKVNGIRPLDDYKLWVRFNTGESKTFDFKPLLNQPAFMSLKDKEVFSGVYIDYGILVWNDGEIDIAPESIYEKGIPADGIASA